jgi:competence protein ComEC
VERPDVLVAGSGGLVGVMTEEGRALSKPRGDGFTADSWLENDGDRVAQEVAHARAGFGGRAGAAGFPLGRGTAIHLSGGAPPERVAEACAEADLVILAARAEAPEGCTADRRGAPRPDRRGRDLCRGRGLRTVTVRDWIGRRPWNDQ